ncbi:putative ammonium transporter 2 isoform X2 [Acanthaster planci]|uniref:Ammonium transporter 2 isoform X2 n=1 Tax=Acanthaster planci TaxID=133434 RepID=A0A8B7ZDI0_ACAPL|nr:putative ammonium transporter 2 isoform X2 [Acanthaster planci]
MSTVSSVASTIASTTDNSPFNTTCPVYVVHKHVMPNDWDDPIWILTSAFVIFTMQSGFGLLESGTATSKNEVNIMVKNAVDVIFGGITYWMVGYAFSFGDQEHENKNAFSGYGNFFLDVEADDTGIGQRYSHFIFQLAFATTATTIVSGAMVERTRLEAYIIFSLLNTLISSFPSHWVWAKDGFLFKMGVVDVAGGGPVHIAGGVTGLVATLMLKPRHRRYKTSDPPPMGSPTNAILGMFMLWWGWLGFNCGSTQGITKDKWALAARSAVATICSSMAGGIGGITLSYLTKRRKFDIGYLIDGVLGALVSITGGCIACGGVELLNKLKIDDPVGVVPVHFFCGAWSLVAAGLFVKHDSIEETNNGTIQHDGLFMGGGPALLGIQLLTVVCITAWCGIIACIILKIISLTIGLRFPFHEELLGADMVEHSIGPRKYDKIKKRLTDSARYRRFEQPRRRIHSSMRQAEDFLSMRDTSVETSYDDVIRRFQDRECDDRNRSGARKLRFNPARGDAVFTISNGNSHATVIEEEHPNGDVTAPDGVDAGPTNKDENDNSVSNKKRRISTQLIRGAFRRRKKVLPKWQRKLGIENVAYIDNERAMKMKTRKARDVQFAAETSHEIGEEVAENGSVVITSRDDLRSSPCSVSVQAGPSSTRIVMVDQSTQTHPVADMCSTFVQTSAEDIFLRSIGIDADCSSIEMEVSFDMDDKIDTDATQHPRQKSFAIEESGHGMKDAFISRKANSRIEYLV